MVILRVLCAFAVNSVPPLALGTVEVLLEGQRHPGGVVDLVVHEMVLVALPDIGVCFEFPRPLGVDVVVDDEVAIHVVQSGGVAVVVIADAGLKGDLVLQQVGTCRDSIFSGGLVGSLVVSDAEGALLVGHHIAQ